MLKSLEHKVLLAAYFVGFIGVLQYLGMTSWLMTFYPGGNLADRGSAGYDFFLNFLSDLGRTNAFGQGSNPTAPYYEGTLAIAGVATMIFFGGMSHFLFHASRNWWAVPCFLMAIASGVGYIGVAVNPINEDYSQHIMYVQIGFIGFWWMCVFCALAIWRSPVFPSKYARMIMWFLGVLGIQILIMLLGPRSWSNPSALLLQVTAQKIVVYSEILVMLILNVATWRATLATAKVGRDSK
jgi:hypothetical protein